MNLYKCKVGDIVMTGDSYGMFVCLCIKESHLNENHPFNVVTFLDMTDGSIHLSGAVDERSPYLDDCRFLQHVPQEYVEKIKKAWKVEQ